MISAARNTAHLLGCPHDSCLMSELCFSRCHAAKAEKDRIVNINNAMRRPSDRQEAEKTVWEISSPRKYLAIKYAAPDGACKCGECHLVPPEMLMVWDAQIEALKSEVEQLRIMFAEQMNVRVSDVLDSLDQVISQVRE